MARRYGNITMDDPMERLLNTVQVLTQLQGTLNSSRESYERIKENKLTNVHERWVDLASTVDFQDLDSINDMRNTLMSQKESYLSQMPQYNDEIETLWSGINDGLTKGIQIHTKFDNAYASIEKTMEDMEPILSEIVNKYGGVIPVDEQEHYIQTVRDTFEKLSKNTALLKGYSNQLPEKYTDIYDNINVANWMQGTLLTQFEEVLDDTEIQLIQNGLNGTMGYNELSSKWKLHQGDNLALWRDNKHKYEGAIDGYLEDWEILEDFKNRYYDMNTNPNALNTMSTAGQGGEYTPPFPGGAPGGKHSPEEVFIYGPDNKTVYKWTFASNNWSGNPDYDPDTQTELTVIEQIEAVQNKIKGHILAKDARYFDLQTNVMSKPLHYNERFEEYNGVWPWESLSPGSGGFQGTWTDESLNAWNALTPAIKKQYRDLGYDMDTEDWFRTTFDSGTGGGASLPSLTPAQQTGLPPLTSDLASEIYETFDAGVKDAWTNLSWDDIAGGLEPELEYPAGSGNIYKHKDIYDIVIGGNKPSTKPTQQPTKTDYLYNAHNQKDQEKINTYYNALNPKDRTHNTVEEYYENLNDKQRSKILKRNVNSTIRIANQSTIAPKEFPDFVNWLYEEPGKNDEWDGPNFINQKNAKVNRGDGKGLVPKKKIWYTDKINNTLTTLYPDKGGWGAHGYFRQVKQLFNLYHNTAAEHKGKKLIKGERTIALAEAKLQIIFEGRFEREFGGTFPQTWRPDGWDYKYYEEEHLKKYNQ